MDTLTDDLAPSLDPHDDGFASPEQELARAGDDDIDWGDDDADDGGGIDWGDDADDDAIDWGDDPEEEEEIDWGDDPAEEPVAETPAEAPVTEAPSPVVEAPVAEAPAPAVEAPAPVVETPAAEPAATPVAAAPAPTPAPAWTPQPLGDAVASLEFADAAWPFLFASAGDAAALYLQEGAFPGDAFAHAMSAVPGASIVTGTARWDDDDDVAVFDGGGAGLLAALHGPLAAEVPVLAQAKVLGLDAGSAAAPGAASLDALVRADATTGGLLARLEAAGPKASDAEARISKALSTLADQSGLVRQLGEKMGARPDPGQVKDAASMTEALTGMRQAVCDEQARGGKVLTKVEGIRAQLLEALNAATGELGDAWAAARATPPAWAVGSAAAPAAAPDGDPSAAIAELTGVINGIAAGMKDLKMNGKSRAVAEFAPRGVPLGLVEDIAAHVAADPAGTKAAIDPLAEAIQTSLRASLETQRQLRQWEEWKSNFPPEKAERVTKNVQELASLLADQLHALAAARGGEI